MCGVYAVTFVSCFGAAVYAILLAHRLEIKKVRQVCSHDPTLSDLIHF